MRTMIQHFLVICKDRHPGKDHLKLEFRLVSTDLSQANLSVRPIVAKTFKSFNKETEGLFDYTISELRYC